MLTLAFSFFKTAMHNGIDESQDKNQDARLVTRLATNRRLTATRDTEDKARLKARVRGLD